MELFLSFHFYARFEDWTQAFQQAPLPTKPYCISFFPFCTINILYLLQPCSHVVSSAKSSSSLSSVISMPFSPQNPQKVLQIHPVLLMRKHRLQTQSPLSIHLPKSALLLCWISLWLPCLFFFPQPPPLYPSCTRSVPPWEASLCHGLSRSSPMESSWTMRSGTMRRWASFDLRLLRPSQHCSVGVARGGHKEIHREEELGAGGQGLPGENAMSALGEILYTHHLTVWTSHWTGQSNHSPSYSHVFAVLRKMC